jgi:cation diffusion facilitator family transporter
MFSLARGLRDVSMTAEKVVAARLSVFSNTLLVVLKLGVGLWTGSVAILSEAVHSATDLLAALIAFFAVRTSDLPPDKEHPYGHGKAESVSGALEALLIFGAAVFIIVEAVRALRDKEPPRALGWGIAVMAGSALVNIFVARYLYGVARRTDSLALRADAQHLSIDVWTSLGVVAGLTLVHLTGLAFLDSLVALVIALVIIHAAYHLTRDAVAPLMDSVLPADEVRVVEDLMRGDRRVLGFHKLRTRKSGSQRHIDVHIQVNDDLTLREAHALTEELEDRVRGALPNAEVVIHTEPYEEERRHHEENPH